MSAVDNQNDVEKITNTNLGQIAEESNDKLTIPLQRLA